MTYPPPPGGPPYPPPQGSAPGPYGPPPQQQWPQPQQQWAPQPQWAPGPPPKKRGNGWKWGLGAVALLAVIGVTAAVSISVTRGGGEGDPTTPAGNDFGLASADDDSPANIITEDPSCAALRSVNDTFVKVQEQGWDKRDPAIPAAEWTSEQRRQYEDVAKAASIAADQSVALARTTPHRVMRELYEQFIAYLRAYVATIPSYTSEDNHLVGVAITTSIALGNVCNAIEWGSAQARAPFAPTPAAPSAVAKLTDPGDPTRFLSAPDPICTQWDRVIDQFNTDAAEWQDLNPNIAATQRTPAQQRIIDAVVPVMKKYADDLEALGRESGNSVLEDFAVFAAQYRRAYAEALPTYTSADYYLARVSIGAESAIYEACDAAGA